MTLLERLNCARSLGEVAFTMAVCDAATEADNCVKTEREDEAIAIFSVLASLDIDDKLISPVVNHARIHLEKRGIACEPSISKDYQNYLDSLPAYNRNVMLGRQCMREMSSGLVGKQRQLVAQRAIEYFELAAKEKPLNKRDQKMVAILRKEVQA